MNRRDLIKTAGLAFAGSALFPFDGLAKTASETVSTPTENSQPEQYQTPDH